MELFTIGVEEEFGLADPADGRLKPAVHRVLAGLSEAERLEIKPDVHQATLETATPVCLDLVEVEHELVRLRRHARRAARLAGVELFNAGAHPDCRWREQPFVHKQRYLMLADHQGEAWLQCLFWGLHVHLGVPDEFERLELANRLRSYLPLFIAFSANSPYWEEKPHPAGNARMDIYSRLEYVGAPPRFDSYDAVDRAIRSYAHLGARQIKDVYWDIRPRRIYPTIECRVCDMQTSVEDSLLLVGLILLAALALRDGDGVVEAAEEEIAPNREAAVAGGYAARISLDGESLSVREALLRFLKSCRALARRADLDDVHTRIARRVESSFCPAVRYRELYQRAPGDHRVLLQRLNELLLPA